MFFLNHSNFESFFKFFFPTLGEFFMDFQTPGSPIACGMMHFHHDLNVLLCFICFFVLWMLTRTIQLFAYPKAQNLVLTRSFFAFNYYKHKNMTLEIVWTLIPAFILMLVAIPSFALLYSSSTYCDPEITVKIIGHQWYWTYELTAETFNTENSEVILSPISFDSYAIESIPKNHYMKNLLTTESLLLPINTFIRILVTSDDVLHSWAVPALGVKIDACPGRLNAVTFIIKDIGSYFGACSEICGINHAFMPIWIQSYEKNLLTSTLDELC